MANIDFKNIESVHYNSTSAVAVAINKLYHELQLQYLHQRRWLRPVCLLNKVFLAN